MVAVRVDALIRTFQMGELGELQHGLGLKITATYCDHGRQRYRPEEIQLQRTSHKGESGVSFLDFEFKGEAW